MTDNARDVRGPLPRGGNTPNRCNSIHSPTLLALTEPIRVRQSLERDDIVRFRKGTRNAGLVNRYKRA
eukprot:4468128-Pyramimonas_sp.AAC.1